MIIYMTPKLLQWTKLSKGFLEPRGQAKHSWKSTLYQYPIAYVSMYFHLFENVESRNQEIRKRAMNPKNPTNIDSIQ